MLYMVVNSHNPESCAFRGDEEEQLLFGGLRKLKSTAPDKGVQVQGWWANRSGHEIFLLVEAPDPHTIEEALIAADLVGRTHTRILPVTPVDQLVGSD